MTEGDKETVIQMYKDTKVEPETYTEYPSPPKLSSMSGFGERRKKLPERKRSTTIKDVI